MSARLSCPPAPGALEAFAAQFDPLLKTPAQRHGFRTYLSGLLLPRDRSKTLTALVGAEPLVQAQAAQVQQLQFFLSEAACGTAKRSMPGAWRCWWPSRRRHLRPQAYWQLTTRGIARTAAPPTTWRASTWARWARSTTASSR